jgi:hypothetical protein
VVTGVSPGTSNGLSDCRFRSHLYYRIFANDAEYTEGDLSFVDFESFSSDDFSNYN